MSPREHAAMETDQSDPLRLAAFQAERLQGLFSIMKMLDHRGLLRNKGLPLGLYITRRLPALRSGWATVSLSQRRQTFPLCFLWFLSWERGRMGKTDWEEA